MRVVVENHGDDLHKRTARCCKCVDGPHSCGVSVQGLDVVKPRRIHQLSPRCRASDSMMTVRTPKRSMLSNFRCRPLLHFGWVELDSGLRTEDALVVLHRHWIQSWFRRDIQEMHHTATPRALARVSSAARRRCAVVIIVLCRRHDTLHGLAMALTSSWRTKGAGLPASMGNMGSGATRVQHTRWSTARRPGLCRSSSGLFCFRGSKVLLCQQRFKTCAALGHVHFGFQSMQDSPWYHHV